MGLHILGMRASIFYYIFLWTEAILLQILAKLFPPKKEWTEISPRGKNVLVTGANSGLGLAIATSFARKGANVILAVRNMREGQAAVDKILVSTSCPRSALFIVHCDLSDLSSVRLCSDIVTQKYEKLDILVNNGGISVNSEDLEYTREGFEAHMGVNHLGHFLLTLRLFPLLKKAPEGAGRVVHISSTGLVNSNLDANDLDLHFARRSTGFGYFPYGNSKLAQATFSKELARRVALHKRVNVKSYAICPGFVKDTMLLRNYRGRSMGEAFIRTVGLELEQAVELIEYCCLAKEAEGQSGAMFRFGKRFWSGEVLMRDRDLMQGIWEESERCVGEVFRLKN